MSLFLHQKIAVFKTRFNNIDNFPKENKTSFVHLYYIL